MIGRITGLLLLAWALGFALFASTLPGPVAEAVRTDAVVVPTGGSGRVPRGLALVEAGAARRMLVTGAAPVVSRRELIRYFGHAVTVTCCVDIGAEAIDTRGNADETAAWVRAHHYRTVRLVTSDWHLRRAELELRSRLGDGVAVIGDGVPTEPSFGQLMNEYHKLLLRGTMLLAERWWPW